MKVNAKQILHPSRKDENFWLFEEIMSSLTPEIIESARKEDGETLEYDIKLQINGFIVEPKLLPKIIADIEKIIDNEAQKLADEKLSDAMREVDVLHQVIKEAEYKIREKFDIKREEDES